MDTWQLQDVKTRLDEVVCFADPKWPQTMTILGKPEAIWLSKQKFNRTSRPKSFLVAFLRESPLAGVFLDLKPDQPYDLSVGP